MVWTAPRTWTDGELVTAAIMNPHVRDNLLAVGPHLIVRKSADESIASSTALQDDDALLMNVPANEVWQFQLLVRYEADAAADILVSFGLPSGGRIISQFVANTGGGSLQTNDWDITTTDGTSVSAQGSGAGVGKLLNINGLWINGGTGGNYRFRWAQASSSGTATVVKANSLLYAVKLA
jgi:hypothetical protein